MSDTNSTAVKTMPVSCPPGMRVLGIGGDLPGGLGQVVLEGLVPNAALTGVTVSAREDGSGSADSWQIQAKATCTTPPAGLVRTPGFSLLDSFTPKTATATCPAGKRVHGVGGEVDGGAGEVRMTAMLASSATTVQVVGTEDENGFAGNWGVRAFAICA